MSRGYGWKPDLPDVRDYKFVKLNPVSFTQTTLIDLQPKCPSVVNQGNLGSCTGNAISNAHLFEQMREKKAQRIVPSRLFIYFNERKMEGTIKQDSGAMIRDGFKSIATEGVCSESSWPYDINKFAKTPPKSCYKTALSHTALQYQRLNNTNLNELKACLASGFPFVFGFTVYTNFESAQVAKDGIVNLPQAGEEVLGGHAVMCVGYDDSTQRFKVMNSWGTQWGNKGYFTIPYSYLTNGDLADDFWTLRLVK